MTDLSDYQRALADAVGQPMADPPDLIRLALLSAKGIAMTGRVRASWCIGRARRAARLTLSALAEAEREAILQDWVASGGGTSSFFETDAESLLDFIAERLEEPSHAFSLCRFERALIRARAHRDDDEQLPPLNAMSLIRRSDDADLIHFHAPVEALLAATEGNRPWPHVGQIAHSLLIAPGIAGQARDACAVEVALWEAAEQPVPAAVHWPTARSMVACGALKIVPGVEL